MAKLLRLRHKNYSQLNASLAYVKPDMEPRSQVRQLHRVWKMINGSSRIRTLQGRGRGVDAFFKKDGISGFLLNKRFVGFLF